MTATRNIPWVTTRKLLILSLGALLLCVGISLLPTKEAFALDSDMEVSIYSDGITPVKRVSYTGEGATLTIDEGDDLYLEGIFEGGEGEITFTWEVSTDGGITYTLLPSTDNFFDIIDAVRGTYHYHLYTYDDGIQRVKTIFEVVVRAPDDPVPPEPPAPVDPPTTPTSTTKPAASAKTGDSLQGMTPFLITLASLGIMLACASAYRGKGDT